MKKIIVAILIVIVAGTIDYLKKPSTDTTNNATTTNHLPQSPQEQKPRNTSTQQHVLQKIRQAEQSQKSGWWLEVKASVIKILRDDTKGHQHQKFLIRLAPDITLLVAHNLDLAPRVPLKAGDSINLRGRYEWNNRGGVLHWTHHDPKGRQKGGWIIHNGQHYK
jgi:uncharacterized protein YxeA